MVNKPFKHRVVISGMGLITPLGNDVQTTWLRAVAGESGIALADDRVGLSSEYPYRMVGQVRNEKPSIDAVISEKNQTKTDRFIQLAMVAGCEAMTTAGLSTECPDDRERFGCYVGVGLGGLGSLTSAVKMLDQGYKKVSPFMIPKSISNEAASWLAMTWNLQGPSVAVSSACASSADAIGMAFRLIRDGYCDHMLVGGAECCVVPVGIVAFGNMRALSAWTGDPAQASRPFDRQRTGFVIAEGAAMLVLERYDLAQARGAHIYAEVVGYGATSDAHHITAMHPEGRGAIASIKAALHDADITPDKVGYINAHGTGTLMNDVIETQVIKKVFGDLVDPSRSGHTVISSTKSMTGHMLGAAGAAEVALTACALQHGIVPPTINLTDPDPACDLDYVPLHARSCSLDYALSNSFGFGGGNVVIALKRI